MPYAVGLLFRYGLVRSKSSLAPFDLNAYKGFVGLFKVWISDRLHYPFPFSESVQLDYKLIIRTNTEPTRPH